MNFVILVRLITEPRDLPNEAQLVHVRNLSYWLRNRYISNGSVLLCCSDTTRALQTAEAIENVLGATSSVRSLRDDYLLPDASGSRPKSEETVQAAQRYVNAQGMPVSIVLVEERHLPELLDACLAHRGLPGHDSSWRLPLPGSGDVIDVRQEVVRSFDPYNLSF